MRDYRSLDQFMEVFNKGFVINGDFCRWKWGLLFPGQFVVITLIVALILNTTKLLRFRVSSIQLLWETVSVYIFRLL